MRQGGPSDGEREAAAPALRVASPALLDAAPVMMWLADVEGRRTFVNRAWRAFTGREAGGDVDAAWLDSIHPDDRARCAGAGLRAVEALGESQHTYRLRHRDGSWRWVSDVGVPLKDEEGAIVGAVGSLSDVTARRRAEKGRRESEDRFRRAFRNAPIGMVLASADGRIREANQAFSRLVGWPEEQLVGRSFLDVTHADDRAASREATQACLNGGSPVLRMQKRYLRRDGAHVWVHVTATLHRASDGRPRYWIVQVQDVTQHRQATHELRRHKERLEAAQRIAHVGHWEWHLATGAWFWSEELFRVLGASPAETAPGLQSFLGRVHADDRPRVKRTLDRVIAEGLGEFKMDHRVESPSGTVRWVHGEGHVERDRRHHPLRVVGTLQDITARREAEQALRESEEQLREAQRFESVRRLAGGIAHDFNNLLLVMTGYAGLLEQRLAHDDPSQREVHAIMDAADRAAKLTRQLLAFSRRQVLQPKVLDLNAVVEEVQGALRRMIGEDIDLVCNLEPGLGTIRADPGQLEQVILNLAVNARDAMPQGGRLTIGTRTLELDEDRARGRGLEPGAYVVLSVGDTGLGMDESIRSQIFEPFFTTKERGKGTGLGLSTVHGIVAQSGGAVLVESEPGEGATFAIHLPRSGSPAEGAPVRTERAASVGGTETLLVVEDDELIHALTIRILKENGYRVIGARSGPEALEQLEGVSESLDLLVTDVVMPGMSGPELVRQVRARLPSLEVLYVTGYADRPELVEETVGVEGALLRKPFTPGQLAEKVRERLDARLEAASRDVGPLQGAAE